MFLKLGCLSFFLINVGDIKSVITDKEKITEDFLTQYLKFSNNLQMIQKY